LIFRVAVGSQVRRTARINNETTIRARKTKNRICAMLAEAPAIPVKPRTPAMIATTRNTSA
jgi:hypothetical protein